MILSSIKYIISVTVDLFYRPFKRYIAQDIFRYGFVGGMNMALDLVLYYMLYNFVFNQNIVDFGFVAMSAHIAAMVFVFPVTFSTGFLLNKYIVFQKSYLRSRIQLIRYALVVLGSILLTYLLLKFFVEVAGFWATPSKFLTTILVTIYSFCMQKFFTFRSLKKNKEKNLTDF